METNSWIVHSQKHARGRTWKGSWKWGEPRLEAKRNLSYNLAPGAWGELSGTPK